MEWYWWVLIMVVGGFIAFQILQWVVGRAINMTDAGRVFLDMQLKKLGVRQYVPNACVIEVADRVSVNWTETAELDNKSKSWAKDQMMPHLLSEARLITCWVSGDPGLEQFTELVASLKKYGVAHGAARNPR